MGGVWRFQDLVAWKLAFELKELVDEISRNPAIVRDVKFHSQLADAAASGPRNLAEGFGRHFHPEFARFARIARASELEVLNHFIDARARGYITPYDYDRADHATKKALLAVNGLIRYLESTPEFGRK
jgi:four helix bundle protein